MDALQTTRTESHRGAMLFTDEADLPSPEKVGIRYLEPRIDIVQSMDRIYAVPSEKLRIWSVWLTKVVDEANEWHKWLHLHVDLLQRISVYLSMAENAIARETERKQTIEKGETDEEQEIEKEVQPQQSTDEIDAQEETAEAEEDMQTSGETVENEEQDGESIEVVPETTEDAENEEQDEWVTMDESTAKEAASDSETEQEQENVGEEAEEVSAPDDALNEPEESAREDSERENEILWPIGIKWKPLKAASKRKMGKLDATEVLEIPKSEDEMREFIKNFTHEATMYASHYKHYVETADQAMKETLCRTVMPTLKVRGIWYKKTLKKLRSKIPPPNLSDTELMRNIAAANEDIPYFFYVKTEPDIDIAIDYNDEKVTLYNQDREYVFGDEQYLFFNLADQQAKQQQAKTTGA